MQFHSGMCAADLLSVEVLTHHCRISSLICLPEEDRTIPTRNNSLSFLVSIVLTAPAQFHSTQHANGGKQAHGNTHAAHFACPNTDPFHANAAQHNANICGVNANDHQQHAKDTHHKMPVNTNAHAQSADKSGHHVRRASSHYEVVE
jgi:hypothetical protein